MKIILIMVCLGLKKTLANELGPLLKAKRLNADEVRKTMIGIFLKKEEKDKQKGWLTLQLN